MGLQDRLSLLQHRWWWSVKVHRADAWAGCCLGTFRRSFRFDEGRQGQVKHFLEWVAWMPDICHLWIRKFQGVHLTFIQIRNPKYPHIGWVPAPVKVLWCLPRRFPVASNVSLLSLDRDDRFLSSFWLLINFTRRNLSQFNSSSLYNLACFSSFYSPYKR